LEIKFNRDGTSPDRDADADADASAGARPSASPELLAI
jgi:hypothetical protein